MARIRIGISGWAYQPWRGVFYPAGLRQKDELGYAASRFSSIEINATFYGTQSPASFLKWAEGTPEDFVFSVKAPRFITHLKRLREVEIPLANFFASGLLRLGKKLGPLLWQFPPNMAFDETLFAAFFALLPRDTVAAAALAARQDGRLKKGVWLETDARRRLRHAVEIRHESFRDPRFVRLLRQHNIALVAADTVEWPLLMDVTSDFVYCRLHGAEVLYASGYDAAALNDWARRIRCWAQGAEPEDAPRILGPAAAVASGRDVFLYFDNDIKVEAPRNAGELAKLLGLT